MEGTVKALAGGVLIGIAATLMLLLNGRVTGISGILNNAFGGERESGWRWSFIAGLMMGGVILYFFNPAIFLNLSGRTIQQCGIAGVLVGFGAAMGGGCTSGHGVCGVSRLSIRSIVATIVFVASGMVFVTFFQGMI